MQLDIFEELAERFTLKNDVALIEFFGGIGSQHKALTRCGFNIVNSRLYEVDINASISYAAVNCGLNETLESDNLKTFEYCLSELLPQLTDYKSYERYISLTNSIPELKKTVDNNIHKIDMFDIDEYEEELEEFNNLTEEQKKEQKWFFPPKSLEELEEKLVYWENKLKDATNEMQEIKNVTEISIIEKFAFKYWKDEQPYAITKMKEDELVKFYYAITLANNHTNIFDVDVKALDDYIKDNKQANADVVLSWSTPCQEFSMAGNRGGWETDKGSLTKVSLDIVEELEHKPTLMFFENVPGIKGGEFKQGFNNMIHRLYKIGYENHILELNAKDFGVPQNRNRIFIISVLKEDLGSKSLVFPQKQELKLTLKDLLEDEVDEKYFLTQEQLDKLVYKETQLEIGYVEKGTGKHQSNIVYKDKLSPTICASGTYKNPPKVLKKVGYYEKDMVDKRIYETDGIAATVVTGGSQNSNYLSSTKNTKIKSAVKRGYEEANDGDGVYLQTRKNRRGMVQSQSSQTIKTSVDVGVTIYKNDKCNVRKLTPLECWRLMSYDDLDYENAAIHMSQTALYKQAGNGIVIKVPEAIFKCMM